MSRYRHVEVQMSRYLEMSMLPRRYWCVAVPARKRSKVIADKLGRVNPWVHTSLGPCPLGCVCPWECTSPWASTSSGVRDTAPRIVARNANCVRDAGIRAVAPRTVAWNANCIRNAGMLVSARGDVMVAAPRVLAANADRA